MPVVHVNAKRFESDYVRLNGEHRMKVWVHAILGAVHSPETRLVGLAGFEPAASSSRTNLPSWVCQRCHLFRIVEEIPSTAFLSRGEGQTPNEMHDGQRIVYRFGIPDAPAMCFVHMQHAFEQAALMLGRDLEEAREIFGVLPITLQCLATHPGPEGLYYHTEDQTFTSKGKWAVMGSGEYKYVWRLYQLLLVVFQRLHSNDWKKIITRLGTLPTHADALEEIIPVERIAEPVAVRYEYGGDASPDLLLEFEHRIPMVLEVKNRRKDGFNFFDQLAAADFNEDNVTLPEAAWLFEKVLHKFQPVAPADRLQGVWSAVTIYHDLASVRRYFDEELPEDRIHFAIVSFRGERAYVVGRTPEFEQSVRSLFQLTDPLTLPPAP